MARDTVETIRSCFLFSDADGPSVEVLARSSYIVRHTAGKSLFMAGDEADGLHVVLSGLVRIWIADAEGHELTLALMEPGDPFGEIALLDGLPRSANATAIEPTECLLTPASALDRALAGNPSLARHLIQLLCELLRRNTEAMSAFAFLDLDGRLAKKLHDLALAHAELEGRSARFTRRFSQTDLGQMLGVTREAVNKRLAVLVLDGLVTQTNGVLVVPDLPALAARVRTASALVGNR